MPEVLVGNAGETGAKDKPKETPKPKTSTQKEPSQPKVEPQSQSQKKKRSSKAGDINTNEMVQFIVGLFQMLGSFMGGHWFISEDEAEQLADPLVSMLNKQNKKKKQKVNDMMLPMLLVSAIGSIIVPRLMIQINEWRSKQDERKRNNERNKSRDTTRKADVRNGDVPTEAPPTTQTSERVRGDGHGNEHVNEHVPTVPPQIASLSD